jgi:hypothetical protein
VGGWVELSCSMQWRKRDGEGFLSHAREKGVGEAEARVVVSEGEGWGRQRHVSWSIMRNARVHRSVQYPITQYML